MNNEKKNLLEILNLLDNQKMQAEKAIKFSFFRILSAERNNKNKQKQKIRLNFWRNSFGQNKFVLASMEETITRYKSQLSCIV